MTETQLSKLGTCQWAHQIQEIPTQPPSPTVNHTITTIKRLPNAANQGQNPFGNKYKALVVAHPPPPWVISWRWRAEWAV